MESTKTALKLRWGVLGRGPASLAAHLPPQSTPPPLVTQSTPQSSGHPGLLQSCLERKVGARLVLSRKGWKQEDGVPGNLGDDWPPAKLGFRTADCGRGWQLQEKPSLQPIMQLCLPRLAVIAHRVNQDRRCPCSWTLRLRTRGHRRTAQKAEEASCHLDLSCYTLRVLKA